MLHCSFCEGLIIGAHFRCLSSGRSALCEQCAHFCKDSLTDEVLLHVIKPSGLDSIKIVKKSAIGKHDSSGSWEEYRASWKSTFVVGERNYYGFVCDGCDSHISPIESRFRCSDCKDFDYCEACFDERRAHEHAVHHAFYLCSGDLALPARNILHLPTLDDDAKLRVEIVDFPQYERLCPFTALDTLTALEASCFPGLQWGAESLRKAHNPLRQSFMDCLIVWEQGQYVLPQLAGYVVYQFEDENVVAAEDECEASRLHIASIAVSPAWQGLSLGSLVLDHALAQAKCAPFCSGAVLHVDVNNSKALGMYRRHGFEVVKEIDAYYGNGHSAYLLHHG